MFNNFLTKIEIMLFFVGLGIDNSLDCKTIEELKSYEVFIENYTMPSNYKEVIEYLRENGIEAKLIGREKVESSFLIEKARKEKIALLIGGDVFSATTHYTLFYEAKKEGIEVKVKHNSSIFSAIAKTGLSIYKFGEACTISFWEENFKPTSPILKIKKNKERGLHSLVLLDIKGKQKREQMKVEEGIKIMLKMEEKEGIKVIEDLLIASRIGLDGEKICYLKIEKAKSLFGTKFFEGFGEPSCFVVPGKLNEIEKEFLSLWELKDGN